MGKRLGRKRLFALNKLGETLTKTAGAGISDSIGNSTRLRSGHEIISELTIDLANGTSAANSYATTGVGASAIKTIGVSSSALPHENAQLLQIDNNTAEGTINGVVISGELICVESPTGGEDNIGLYYADSLSGSDSAMDVGSATELCALEVMTLGDSSAFTVVDADIDNKYVYLVSSGSTAGTYTAGKFVLRLYGYSIFDDVS